MQSVGLSACDSPDLKEQMRHAVGGMLVVTPTGDEKRSR